MRGFRYLAVMLCVCMLQGCGGGGGGGGGHSDNFSVSPNSVTFTATVNGATPAPQVVNGTITGVNSTVYLFVQSPGVAIANASVAVTSSTTGQLTLYPKSPAALGIGTFTETVVVRACLDPNCSSPISGSPRNISVTYNVIGLTAAPTNVSLSAFEGTASSPVTVNLANGSGANWSSTINYAAGPTGWLTLNPATGSTNSAAIALTGGALTIGTYNATVIITAGALTLNIPVTYTVHANLGATGNASFTAVSGQPTLPAAIALPVTAVAGTTNYTTSITYGAGATNWLGASGSTAPGTLSLAPTRTDLAPGATYTATVVLTPSTGAAVSVPVSYMLSASALTLNPSPVTFSIDAASTSADSFVRRSVTTGDTGAQVTWTAASNVPWLTVTGNGSSGSSATLTLVPAQLATIANGTATATVTFTYGGPGFANTTKTLPVSLNLQLPIVNYAAPYVAYVNEQLPVIVRGVGFSQAGGNAVTFGGIAAQSVVTVSDTELRVTPPVLGNPGRLPVRVSNGLAIDRGSADLVVRSHPNYAYAAVSTAAVGAGNLNFVYDAERDAVFSAHSYFGQSTVSSTLFRYDGTAGWAATSKVFDQLFDAALSTDGKYLLVLTTTQLHLVDPVTLNIQRSITLPGAAGGTDRELGVMNDGKVLIQSAGLIYSLSTDAFSPLGLVTGVTAITTSLDGSRAVFGYATNGSDVPLSFYDASTGVVSLTSAFQYFAGGRLNRDGTRLLADYKVRDQNFSLIGSIDTSNTSYFGGTLSPDGSRVYMHGPGGGVNPAVRVFDAATPATQLNELTPLSLTDDPGSAVYLLTSQDGKTLFLLGDQKLVVLPLP